VVIKFLIKIQQGQSLLGKAQEAISNTAQSVKDTISGNKK
jgi:hypothetical protein